MRVISKIEKGLQKCDSLSSPGLGFRAKWPNRLRSVLWKKFWREKMSLSKAPRQADRLTLKGIELEHGDVLVFEKNDRTNANILLDISGGVKSSWKSHELPVHWVDGKAYSYNSGGNYAAGEDPFGGLYNEKGVWAYDSQTQGFAVLVGEAHKYRVEAFKRGLLTLKVYKRAPRQADHLTLWDVEIEHGDVLDVGPHKDMGYRGNSYYGAEASLRTASGDLKKTEIFSMKPYSPETPINWVDGVPYVYDKTGNHGPAFGDMFVTTGVWVFDAQTMQFGYNRMIAGERRVSV